MKYSLSDILDLKKISKLLDSYSEATGMVSALLDIDGNILAQSRWQKICTDFHRVHPETSKNCTVSDTDLANKLDKGGVFNVYKCLNGLIDVAVPLKVDGQHIGNLFTGQFFLKKPDKSFFIEQAKKYNFDQAAYLSAFSKVPVLKEKDIKTKLEFLLEMTKIIAELGIAKLVELRAKEDLAKSEKNIHDLFAHMKEGFALCEIINDPNGNPVDYKYLQVNKEFGKILNVKPENVISKRLTEVFPGIENDPANWIQKFGEVATTGKEMSFEDFSPAVNKWFFVQAFCPKIGQFAFTFTDISKRKITETNLLDSEAKFRAIVEQSITGIYIFSKERFIYVNKRFCEIFGYSHKEIIENLKPSDVVIAKDRKTANQKIADRLSGKIDSAHYITRGNRKDKRELWVEIHGTHIVLNGENVITGTVIDITDAHLSSIKIERSEEKFRTVFESSNIGKSITLPTGEINVNKAFCDMLGYSKKELQNKKWQEITPNEEIDDVQSKIDPLLEGKLKSTRFTKRYIHKNGSFIWADVSASIVRDDDARPLHFITTIVDITERKMAEERLKKSEHKFRSLFEQAAVGVSIIDSTTGKYLSVNKKQCSMIGYDRDEMLSSDFISITHPDDIAEDLEYMERLRKGEINSFVMEKRYIHKDGSIIWVILNVARLWLEGEAPNLHVAICEDITKQKLTEEKIQQLNIDLENRVKKRTLQLEELNKELETFTYSVSHDLKAPLRGIDGYSKLLLDSYSRDLVPEAQNFLHNIRTSTQKMNLLIDDLLEYSRLERTIFRQDKINIRSFIDSVISSYNDELKEGNYVLELDIPDIEIIADLRGLTIAVRNVVENAIKFSKNQKQPKIKIILESNKTSWTLIFSDNGIGFDMKYHSKIFEIFQRLHRAEDYPGTGIGLAMVGKAMHRMKGVCRAESVPGLGSSFYLVLPNLN
jgi:PAS domain S-box-containing protein